MIFSGWFGNEIGESVLATGCAGSGFHSSTFPTCIEANQQSVSRTNNKTEILKFSEYRF